MLSRRVIVDCLRSTRVAANALLSQNLTTTTSRPSAVPLETPAVSSSPVSAAHLLGFAAGAAAVVSTSQAGEARSKDHAKASTSDAPPITLYQYEVCPYCCKVKAFLDYHKIPYRVVEVDPLRKKELAWSDYKKVPQMVDAQGTVTTDSNAIIRKLLPTAHSTGRRSWAKGGKKAPPSFTSVEEKWLAWADDKFVKMMTANIYRTWGESWQTFDYITEHGNFGAVQAQVARLAGAVIMFAVGKGMPAKYGMGENLREELYDCMDEFIDAMGEMPFMGGNVPCIADLAAFGYIRAITGTDTYWDLLNGSRALEWFTRMSDAVGPPARVAGPPPSSE